MIFNDFSSINDLIKWSVKGLCEYEVTEKVCCHMIPKCRTTDKKSTQRKPDQTIYLYCSDVNSPLFTQIEMFSYYTKNNYEFKLNE